MRTPVKLAVPVLLAAVASVHLYLGQTEPLNPWVGGGFGMFASVDRRESRAVRATAEVGQNRVALDVQAWAVASSQNGGLYDRVVALPSRDVLERMEDELREEQWSDEGALFENVEDGRPAPGVNGVEITVWRAEYDQGASTARPVRIAAHRGEQVSR